MKHIKTGAHVVHSKYPKNGKIIGVFNDRRRVNIKWHDGTRDLVYFTDLVDCGDYLKYAAKVKS